jgi:hypothetical protein
MERSEMKGDRRSGLFIRVRGRLEPNLDYRPPVSKRERERKRASSREYHHNLKMTAFRHYSGQAMPSCRHCGFIDVRALDLHLMKGKGYGLSGHPLYSKLKAHGYPEGYVVLCSSCNNELAGRGHPTPLKLEIIALLSPEKKCARCPETNPQRLTVDHVRGEGRRHLESLVASGEIGKEGAWYIWLREELRDKSKRSDYQILCWNCQRIKEYEVGRLRLPDMPPINSNIFRERADATRTLTTFGYL